MLSSTAKSICDLTQILLGYGPWGFVGLIVLVLQGGKMFCRAIYLLWVGGWELWDEIRRWVIRLSGGGLVWNLLAGAVLYFVFSAFAPQISNSIQWAEQTWWPIYLAEIEADTSSAASAAYERRIGRNLGPTDYALFVRRTAEIAAKCGSSPLNFYEVYESECSCDPFAVNQRERRDKAGRLVGIDTVAAGQIQFTAAGVSGLVLNGEAVTMWQVKQAVKHKKLAWLMDLQEIYMARASGGKPLTRPCDVYTAVFMPAFVGKGMETVLASRWSGNTQFYWQNLGLDGYQLDGKGRVLFLPSSRDGVITIKDLAFCLAAKKAAVCRAEKRN